MKCIFSIKEEIYREIGRKSYERNGKSYKKTKTVLSFIIILEDTPFDTFCFIACEI